MRRALFIVSALFGLLPLSAAAQEEEFSFFSEEEPNTLQSSDAFSDGETERAINSPDAASEEDSFSFFSAEEVPATSSAPIVQPAAPAPSTARPLPLAFRFNGELGVKGLSDVLFDQEGEDVSEFQSWALVIAELRFKKYLRFYTNLALYWGMRGRRPKGDKPYLLFNTSDKRYNGGIDLLETFLEANLPYGLSLRLGNLLFSWGQNDILPAVSLLNPLDARLNYPNGLKLHAPVPALLFTWNKSWFTAHLAFIPWFKPHKVALIDKDMSLAPAGSDFYNKLSLLKSVSPTLLEELVDDPLATEPPDYSIKNSTIGLRLMAESKQADFAISAVYGFDRTPKLLLDKNLITLAGAAGAILENPALLFTDAALADAFVTLQNNYKNGDEIFSLTYLRSFEAAFDMDLVLGDFILKLDLTFTPQKIFYDSELNFSRSPFLKSVLAVEYSYGTSLYLSLTAFALFSFNNEIIPLLDFKRAGDKSSYLVGFIFMGRKTFWEDRFKIELLGAVSATYGDFLIRASLEYKLLEQHIFGLGTTVIWGPPNSLGARYNSNDSIFTYYRWLF